MSLLKFFSSLPFTNRASVDDLLGSLVTFQVSQHVKPVN